MNNPIWLTVVVAVMGPLGALGSQWLTSQRAFRLAERDRDNRRDERDYKDKREVFATALAAARTIRPTARTVRDKAAMEPVLLALRDAGAHVDLQAPELADDAMAEVLEAAERLLELVTRQGTPQAVIAEAEARFDRAFERLRSEMRAQLAN